MLINDIINPPAHVIQAEKSIQQWHEQGLEAEKQRSNSSLSHAEALFQIQDLEGWRELGFDTMQDYVYGTFSRGSSWLNKLTSIHKKLVIDLNIPQDVLEAATFGKLSKVASAINEENKDEILENIKDMSQQDVDNYIKGFSTSSDEEYDEEKEKQRTLRYKGPESMVQVVESAMEIAKDNLMSTSEFYEYSDQVPDMLALNFISGNFISGADLEGNAFTTLENSIRSLEAVYEIKINWTKNAT